MHDQSPSDDEDSSRVGEFGALVKGGAVWVGSWLKAHVLLFVMVSVGAVGLIEWAGVQTGIPPAVAPYTVYFSIAGAVAYYPSKALLDWLEEKFGIPLHDVDPASGDAAGYLLMPQRWEDITVEAPHSVDSDGNLVYEEVDKDQLHTINTKHGVGYECTNYDNATNTARTSWMAGAGPNEIRAFKKTLKRVETTLSILADLGIEESMNRTPIIRAITEKLTRYLVMCHEQGTIPNGGEINGVVTETLAEHGGDDWTTIEDKVENRLPDEYAISEAMAGSVDHNDEARAQVYQDNGNGGEGK